MVRGRESDCVCVRVVRVSGACACVCVRVWCVWGGSDCVWGGDMRVCVCERLCKCVNSN